MSLACAHSHSYVICMSLVCTRMSSVCHWYVLACQPYVTRMYSYVICMSLVYGFTMNSMKTLKTLKANVVTVFWYKFSSIFEFLKSLKLCSHICVLITFQNVFCMNFNNSNSYCVYLVLNFYLATLILAFCLWFALKTSLLCSHDRKCFDRVYHEVPVQNIQDIKSGSTGKLKVLFKHWLLIYLFIYALFIFDKHNTLYKIKIACLL